MLRIVEAGLLGGGVYAVSADFQQCFRLTQVLGLEREHNSWFVDDCVIADGRMLGLVPVDARWLLLSALSLSTRPVFMSLDDHLTALADAHALPAPLLALLTGIHAHARAATEGFLAKFLPVTRNPVDGSLGFRYDAPFCTARLGALVRALCAAPEGTSVLVGCADSLLAEKWAVTTEDHRKTALLLEHLRTILPPSLLAALCTELQLQPKAPEQMRKKPCTSTTDITPNCDYSRPAASHAPSSTAKKPTARPPGVPSISAFFAKAAKK